MLEKKTKTKKQKITIKEFFRNTIKILKLVYKTDKIYVIGMLLLILSVVILNYFFQGSLSNVINKVADKKAIDKDFIKSMIIFSIAFVLPSILNALEDMVSNLKFIKVNKKLDLLFIQKKSELDIQIQDDPENKDLLSRVKDQYASRVMNFIERLEYMVDALLFVGISLFFLISFNWKMAVGIMLLTIPELYVNLKYSGNIYTIFFAASKKRKAYFSMKNYFNEVKELSEMFIFKSKKYFFDKINDYYDTTNIQFVKAEKRATILRILTKTISRLGIMGCIIFVILTIIKNNGEIGTITFIYYAITRYRDSLSDLFRLIGRNYEDSLYLKDFVKFMELNNVIKIKDNPVKINKKIIPTIEFIDVSFKYPKTDRYVLENFNLKIEAGQKLAIVGENGSGKSTFVKLLLRFYDVDKGKILINGVDIKDLDIDSYYDKISVLFQDFVKYNCMNVKEAIAIGDVKKKLDMEKIIDASSRSGADGFIRSYKHQYDQNLGRVLDESEEPSGGQWQKLAIARVFYRDSHIWILDEPTSAIDAQAEYDIFQNLKKIEDKTLIFISHRFSTVRKADKICVISNGTVEEYGTHEELMKQDKIYKRLFTLQAEEYIR